MQIKIYLYDSHTHKFIGETTIFESSIPPINSTKAIPPEEESGKFITYNPVNDDWVLTDAHFVLLHEGGLIRDIEHGPLKITTIEALGDYTATEPNYSQISQQEDEGTLARWTGEAWEYLTNEWWKPTWDPELNSGAGGIKEGLSDADANKQYDRQTERKIKAWCVEQTKNEEYYLNKGIANSSDSEYQAYLTQRATIIASQAAKKYPRS